MITFSMAFADGNKFYVYSIFCGAQMLWCLGENLKPWKQRPFPRERNNTLICIFMMFKQKLFNYTFENLIYFILFSSILSRSTTG